MNEHKLLFEKINENSCEKLRNFIDDKPEIIEPPIEFKDQGNTSPDTNVNGQILTILGSNQSGNSSIQETVDQFVTMKMPKYAMIKVKSDSSTKGEQKVLLDSGAVASVAKRESLKNPKYSGSPKSFAGFTGPPQKSYGESPVKIQVGTMEIHWPMQIFNSLGPTKADAVLGRDFLHRRVIMDWITDTLSIKTGNCGTMHNKQTAEPQVLLNTEMTYNTVTIEDVSESENRNNVPYTTEEFVDQKYTVKNDDTNDSILTEGERTGEIIL